MITSAATDYRCQVNVGQILRLWLDQEAQTWQKKLWNLEIFHQHIETCFFFFFSSFFFLASSLPSHVSPRPLFNHQLLVSASTCRKVTRMRLRIAREMYNTGSDRHRRGGVISILARDLMLLGKVHSHFLRCFLLFPFRWNCFQLLAIAVKVRKRN